MPTVERPMQSIEKNERREPVQDLFAEKEKLFDELREREGDIDLSDKAKLVSRILEHSVDDGLYAASMFGISADGLREQMTRIGFLLKHERLIEMVLDEVARQLRGDETILKWMERMGGVTSTPDINDPSAGAADLFRAEKKFFGPQSLQSPLAQELYKKIDELYAKFLTTREIKSVKEIPLSVPDVSKEKDGVQMAEEHLIRVQKAQTGHYTSEGLRQIVLDAFFDTLPDEERRKAKQRYADPMSDPKLKDRFIQWFRALPMKPGGDDPLNLFASDAFFEASFGKGVVSIFTDTDDPRVKKKLEQAKYKVHETVAAVGELTAERKLISEIKTSLQQKGFDPEKITVEPTGSSGEYEVAYQGREETEDQPFDWDLNTFQKTEMRFNNNAIEGDVVDVRAWSGGAIVTLEMSSGGSYLYFLSGDKTESSLVYDSLEFVGEIGGKMYTIGKFPNGIYSLLENTNPLVTAMDIDASAVIDADGKVAFARQRVQDQQWAIYHDGKEILLDKRIEGVSHLQYDKNGNFYYVGRIGIEEGVFRNTEATHVYMLNAGDSFTALFYKDGTVASVISDGANNFNSAQINGQNIVRSDGRIQLLTSGSGQFIFCNTRFSESQFVYPDGSMSVNKYSFIGEQSEIDGEMVVPVTKVNNDLVLYHTRDKREEFICTNFFGIQDFKVHKVGGEIIIEESGYPLDKNGKLVLKNHPSNVQSSITIDDEKVVIALREDVGQTTKVVMYEKERQKVTKPVERKMALTMEEEKRIMLLNAMRVQHLDIPVKEKTDAIENYFSAYPPADTGSYTAGPKDITAINRGIKEHPELFLDTMAAVPDRRSDQKYIEHIADRLFPQIVQVRAKRKRSMFSRLFGRRETLAESYLTPHAEGSVEDGDPTEPNPKEVMRFRETPPTMVVTRILGGYDQETGKWSESHIPFAPHLGEPTKEYTAEITSLNGLNEVLLPVMAGAEVIRERVKAISHDGEETTLVIYRGAGGQAITNIGATLWDTPRSVAYSQRLSELPLVPSDISVRGFERWKKEFIDRFGTDLTETTAYLPAELNVFLDSIVSLTPKEKLVAIQNYVREIGYYDFDNKEVMEEKRGSSLAERFSIMRSRMGVLKQQAQPEMQGLLKRKQFAGVCADFGLLTVAMLRKAGLPAGFVQGFRPGGTIVTTNDAHGCAFVAWPEERTGRPQMILVDGTPGGVTTEEQERITQFQFPSLEEQKEVCDEKIEEMVKKAEETVREMLSTIEQHDEQSIRELTNGQLEKALNIILRYEVKQSHVNVLRQMFNVAEYSPAAVRSVDLFKLENRVAFLSWIKQSVASTRMESEMSDTTDKPAGSQLMDTVQEFEQRFAKSFNSDRNRAFELMQLIVDTSADYLSKTEQRAATAVITYLRAKQMVKR